jgi:hypothetical protein
MVPVSILPSSTPDTVAAAPVVPADLYVDSAWCGPHDGEGVQAYQDAARLGIKILMPPCKPGSGYDEMTPDQQDEMATEAHEAGVQIMWWDPAFVTDPAAAIVRIPHNPGIAGVFMTDEPGVGQFAQLGAAADILREQRPELFAYVNLLGGSAGPGGWGTAKYEDYIRAYVDAVHPQVMSFDNYGPLKAVKADFDTIRGIVDPDMPIWAAVNDIGLQSVGPDGKRTSVLTEPSSAERSQYVDMVRKLGGNVLYFTFTKPWEGVANGLVWSGTGVRELAAA